MKNYESIFLIIIVPFILCGSIKQNSKPNSLTESTRNITIPGETFLASSDLSIADMQIVEGDAGQRSVEVMVIISQATSGPVTVAYSTKNGTALAGSDYVAESGSVNFARGEIMKKITVSVNGDKLAEADETFEIILSNPSGASLSNNNIGTVTIVNDDSRADNFPVYEVRFTYTGFTSFLGGLKDCPVRPDGKVIMTGLLTGREKVSPDEDIVYTGTLQMDMDIDICTASLDDNDTCRITIVGSGLVPAELKVSFDGRGAYIKLGNASDRFMKNVSGTCDKGQIDEERTMVPDKTIASVFNGTDLAMLVDRTLRIGRYVQPGDDHEIEIVVEVLRKIK
ncbi:MAG: Calx-beta domain-containing protein [Chitinophagaceae bacterium]